jgi:hypothetical protein
MRKSSATKLVTPRSVPADLEAIVLEAVRAAPSLKASQLKKALPKPYQPFESEARVLARDLVRRGQLYSRIKGSSETFFARDPMLTLNETVPTLISTTPLSEALLKAPVAKIAAGHEDLLKDWLSGAVARKAVFEHPALPPAKGKRYGVQPPKAPEPDVGASLKSVFSALKKALVKTDALGVSRRRIADALLTELGLPAALPATVNSPPGPASRPRATPEREEFVSALRALIAENPGQALLSVRDLRARVALNKQEFDSVALDLSREGALSLHHHDHPSALSELERNELVRDARGTYYIGIAARTL